MFEVVLNVINDCFDLFWLCVVGVYCNFVVVECVDEFGCFFDCFRLFVGRFVIVVICVDYCCVGFF